jgi:predicted RNA methylase
MTLADVSSRPRPATTEVPFTTYDIQACLYDTRRVKFLRDAIAAVVKPGDVVVDAGSGTGLLGMFAAEAGAAKVYCLEFNLDAIPVLVENARRNGWSDRIVAVHTNATTWEPPAELGAFDVIISEVMSAGFFYEPQLQILNHLRTFLKPDGAIVPMAMRNYVELLDAQEMLYGLRFNYDTRFTSLPGDTALTGRAAYHTADFYSHNPTSISATVPLRTTNPGLANALRVSYDITFAPGITATEPTDFLLNPQIIFLRKPVKLEGSMEYDVSIAYEASSSPLTSVITVGGQSTSP